MESGPAGPPEKDRRQRNHWFAANPSSHRTATEGQSCSSSHAGPSGLNPASLTGLGHLQSRTALTALVGQRIYYVNAPQDVQPPYVVFFKVSATRVRSLTASSHFVNSRFQFSIFSETYYEAKQIAEHIQLALQDKNN